MRNIKIPEQSWTIKDTDKSVAAADEQESDSKTAGPVYSFSYARI
jgi:hypothetical protein